MQLRRHVWVAWRTVGHASTSLTDSYPPAGVDWLAPGGETVVVDKTTINMSTHELTVTLRKKIRS